MSREVLLLENYDPERFGPLLGVSDEGSAAEVIARAAGASAKAQAAGSTDPATVGVIIDGERMTSAGELPIGPEEYAAVIRASKNRTYCTTNVGVRLNARHYQPLPELDVAVSMVDRTSWREALFASFRPFIETPDQVPRPLTVRLLVSADEHFEPLTSLITELEAGRDSGRLGPRDLHRLSFLIVFDSEIKTPDQHRRIRELVDLAATLDVPEVAIDGDLVLAARRRLGVQGLLNVLSPDAARTLMRYADAKAISLTYRYELDSESAARTVWTGLSTARSYGLSGAKYGLVPLLLEGQRHVVGKVQTWIEGLTAIPAFYADTPLVSRTDVLLGDRAAEALREWLDMARDQGARVVLVDCPDRITPRIDTPGHEAPRRLVRWDGPGGDHGILTLNEVGALSSYAAKRGLQILWSGGIRPSLAWELGALGVFGIFTTSSTARPIRVGDVLASDWQLAAETEPTWEGVRRVHALLQAGFLSKRLASAASELRKRADPLIAADPADSLAFQIRLEHIDTVLIDAWKKYWSDLDGA